MDQVPCVVRGVFVAVSSGSPVPVIILDTGGDASIPIFIGLWEAISINNALNNEIPPRPLTHDLIVNFMDRYHITMKALMIDSIEEGVFYAKMVTCARAEGRTPRLQAERWHCSRDTMRGGNIS